MTNSHKIEDRALARLLANLAALAGMSFHQSEQAKGFAQHWQNDGWKTRSWHSYQSGALLVVRDLALRSSGDTRHERLYNQIGNRPEVREVVELVETAHNASVVAFALDVFVEYVEASVRVLGVDHAASSRPAKRHLRALERLDRGMTSLRNALSDLSASEEENQTGMNLRQWLILVAEVAHASRFSAGVIQKTRIASLKSPLRRLLHANFAGHATPHGYRLMLSSRDLFTIVSILGDYACLIRASVGSATGSPWSVRNLAAVS